MSPKMENSPTYVVPCKKRIVKKVESSRTDFDEEKNKMEDVCRTDKHPSEMLDLSVFLWMQDEPANALPGKKEPSNEATSACNELDEIKNCVDDVPLQMTTQVNFWIHQSFLKGKITPHMLFLGRKRLTRKLNTACCEEEKNQTEAALVFKFFFANGKRQSVSSFTFHNCFSKSLCSLWSWCGLF